MQRFPDSELIINPDGSIYHLQLKPEQLAQTIITVGDPQRVEQVSKYFDSVQHKVEHREFVTHTGYLNNKHVTVISTGIGTDNIDIVLNELDALVNIDFASREVKPELTQLEIVRLGTSGSVSPDIDVDSVLVSELSIGMDSLMHFYQFENTIQETIYLEAFNAHLRLHYPNARPYMASSSEALLKRFESHYQRGTTVTAAGFYAPQGRVLRYKPVVQNLVEKLSGFKHPHFRITNLEMETAGIYALGRLLGHKCLSVSAILANRINNTFSSNPHQVVDRMIRESLEIITS